VSGQREGEGDRQRPARFASLAVENALVVAEDDHVEAREGLLLRIVLEHAAYPALKRCLVRLDLSHVEGPFQPQGDQPRPR
jgi:hypothetical protein